MPKARELLVQGINAIEDRMNQDRNFVADVSGKILSQEMLVDEDDSDIEKNTERERNDVRHDFGTP